MGFSDIIQPGLIQLQPSFDDFMDTLPSLSGKKEAQLYHVVST